MVIEKFKVSAVQEFSNHYTIADEKGILARIEFNRGMRRLERKEYIDLFDASLDMFAALKLANEALQISEVYQAMKSQCGIEPLSSIQRAIKKAEGK